MLTFSGTKILIVLLAVADDALGGLGLEKKKKKKKKPVLEDSAQVGLPIGFVYPPQLPHIGFMQPIVFM